MDIIVGTAGHIDHGKTALVKALTGTDADRLPDEKRRGITIDLGFAEMTIGDTHFGFVDVPGHERFVRNMLAGAIGIDIVLLVIAADEGVMPQTREHFDICRLLDIKRGIIALTKSDLVDAETLDIARMEVVDLVAGSFLESAPIVAVSARTGSGIADLQAAMVLETATITPRGNNTVTRLPIDRSFSVMGFGTVVTGTLASGKIDEASPLEILPSLRGVRARGLQTHGSKTGCARAGQRTAVNLAGVDHAEVGRGMTLAEAGALRPTQALDAEVDVLSSSAKSLRSRQRLRIHLGTAELLARIQVLNEEGEIGAGKRGLVQLRLETPTVAIPGERLIIRSYSPQTTIAGGAVLDPLAERHRRRDLKNVTAFLTAIKGGLNDAGLLVGALIKRGGSAGCTIADLVARTGYRSAVIEDTLRASTDIIRANGRYIGRDDFNALVAASISVIEAFYRSDKLAKGIPRETLRAMAFAYLPGEIFDAVVTALISTGTISLSNDVIVLASRKAELSQDETHFRNALISTLGEAGLSVPRIHEVIPEVAKGTLISAADATKLMKAFAASGDIVRVTDEFYFARNVIEDLTLALRNFADATPDRSVDVAKFKELAGVSRKYAIPLLEYFDRIGVTRRAGEKRVITK